MPSDYEGRLFHFRFGIDQGRFVITTELDDEFERTANIGPIISSIAKENQGDPFKRQEAIHRELYTDVLKEWAKYQDGEAPAVGEL